MRHPRVHVDHELAPGMTVTLPAVAANHLVRVLRLQFGDRVTLFNGDGHEYETELIAAGKHDVRVRVIDGREVDTRSSLRLTLAQSLARGDKMDWIVQKATELGVERIVPVISERTEVRLSGDRAQRRWSHWHGIIVGACEQSGRTRLPGLEPIQPLERWLSSLRPGVTRIVLSPRGQARLRDLSPDQCNIILAVGPEGGYSDADLALFRQADFQPLRLGPRTLRTETAGLAALAGLQSLCGDL